MVRWVCRCTGYCYGSVTVEADNEEEAEAYAVEEFEPKLCPEDVDCECTPLDDEVSEV